MGRDRRKLVWKQSLKSPECYVKEGTLLYFVGQKVFLWLWKWTDKLGDFNKNPVFMIFLRKNNEPLILWGNTWLEQVSCCFFYIGLLLSIFFLSIGRLLSSKWPPGPRRHLNLGPEHGGDHQRLSRKKLIREIHLKFLSSFGYCVGLCTVAIWVWEQKEDVWGGFARDRMGREGGVRERERDGEWDTKKFFRNSRWEVEKNWVSSVFLWIPQHLTYCLAYMYWVLSKCLLN